MNLKKLTDYLNRRYRGFEIGVVTEICGESENKEDQFAYKEVLTTANQILLKDETEKVDALARLDEEIGNCHYDNGVGLNEKEWYFSHYDRDTDYWSWFEGFEINRFELIDSEIFVFLEIDREGLHDIVVDTYDGVSYEHDFPNEK